MLLYIVSLFFVLTPGILVTLPAGGSKTTVAIVHALLFALIFWLTHKFVWKATKKVSFGNLEGFESAEHDKNKHFSHSIIHGASEYSSAHSKK